VVKFLNRIINDVYNKNGSCLKIVDLQICVIFVYKCEGK